MAALVDDDFGGPGLLLRARPAALGTAGRHFGIVRHRRDIGHGNGRAGLVKSRIRVQCCEQRLGHVKLLGQQLPRAVIGEPLKSRHLLEIARDLRRKGSFHIVRLDRVLGEGRRVRQLCQPRRRLLVKPADR